jgi:hypothetical protein
MMNRSVNVLIGICLLSAVTAAQRGGSAAGHPGTARPAHGMRPGNPAWPSRDLPGWGAGRLWRWDGFHSGWNQPAFSVSYPASSGTYTLDPSPTQSSGGVILILGPAPQPTPEPPPLSPIRSEMREYSWPHSSGGSASPYAIILKDGTVRRAVALCRQDSMLTYVAPDGTGGAVEASTIDREATRRANSIDLLQ